jgi:mono/diheme cytochrome c family protein
MKRNGLIFSLIIISALFVVGTTTLVVLSSLPDFSYAASDDTSAQKKVAAQRAGVARAKSASPLLPAFADRTRVPASGKQGPPAAAASLTGSWKKGEVLFSGHCQSCHGPRGTDKVPNPGSADGTVPPLNPVDPDLADKNPAAFAANIDRFIQHGSIPDGPDPALFMPDWGDSRSLSQQEIASVEAYIMRLNGVKRTK